MEVDTLKGDYPASSLPHQVDDLTAKKAEPESIGIARAVLEAEANELHLAAGRLGDNFARALDLVVSRGAKVVVTGLGKSGHIAHKIAATLCSTGTPAVFLHAAEAAHGDVGVYCMGDPTILISKSGATVELLRLVPVLRSFRSPLIGILGNITSPLAAAVDIVLDASVHREADSLNLAPTSSSTVAMGIGDALAIALMRARKFSDEDFARFHPSGQLGRSLWLSVADIMHERSKTACIMPGDSIRQVVMTMTQCPLGAACVLDGSGALAGIITDGDLRRALQQHDDIRSLHARDIMTSRPVTISPEASLREAEILMEQRRSPISVLPVVDRDRCYLGLVRIHDLYGIQQ